MISEKISGVYEIINTKTGRAYIGSSANIENRIRSHRSALKHGKHQNKEMQADFSNGASFTVRLVKRLATDNHNELLKNEAEAIRKRQEQGKPLYNVGKLQSYDYFISKGMLLKKIADNYCKKHFGRRFEALTNCAPAKIEMYYHLIDAETEEDRERIKREYAEIIDYQNKKRQYSNLYGLDYDKMMELSEEERREEIRKATKDWKRRKKL